MSGHQQVSEKRGPRLQAALAVLLLTIGTAPAAHALTAQEPLTLDDVRQLSATPWFGVSPDGSRVVYLLIAPGTTADLWLVPSAGGEATRVTEGADVRSVAGWSPDGGRLAYFAPRDEEAALWIVEPGAEPRIGCGVPQGARSPGWLADGRLTFSARVASIPGAETSPGGSAADGEAVFVCQPEGGEVRQVTPRGYHGLEFAWSPAGDRIAISHQAEPGFYEGLESDLLLVDALSGDETPLVTRPGIDRSPLWSPDGTWIAFISGFGRSGLLPNLGVAVVRAGGGPASDIGAVHDRGGFFEGPFLHAWSPDGREILYSVLDGLEAPLYSLPAAGGAVTRIPIPIGEGEVAYQYSIARDGRSLAFKRSSTDRPPDVFFVRLDGSPEIRLTDLHAAFIARGLRRAERVRWSAPDGEMIEGVLLRPPESAGPGPHPLVTVLHGGPASTYNLGFPGLTFFNPYQDLLLATHGYAVFLPNPRGSGGYGEAFRRAARRDWGHGPAADVQAGIDHLVAEGVADAERLALMGWSYGGYLAAWMLAHSGRFAMGSVGAGVFDLTTHYGLGAPQLEEYFGGPPWRLPALYREQSPIHHVARIRTPILIFHGADDTAVSFAQSELLLAALRAEGVPAELVRYTGEGHSLRQAATQDDSWARLLAWLESWIGSGSSERSVAGSPGAAGGTPAESSGWSDDVTTLDGIIQAYYDVISGPAGTAPDRDRDQHLHHPDALVAITGVRPDGSRTIRTMTLDEYHESFGGTRMTGFFEREIHRETQRFGNVAHVWSTYESSREPAQTPFARGINSIQLYHDGERWWITSWIFDSERPDNPIPQAYLPGVP